MPRLCWHLKFWVGTAICLLAFILPARETGLAPKDLRSEYIVDSWQTEHGLPDNFITCIAQTPEGYLWIATFNGLIRFNGTEFVTFDAANTPQLWSSRITELRVDRAGRLWIKDESGAVCAWRNGQFKRFALDNGTPLRMHYYREDHAGEIWLEEPDTKTGYLHLAGDRFEHVADLRSFYARFGMISDRDGRCWTVSSNSLVCVDGSSAGVMPIPGYDMTGWRLCPSKDGGLWFIANRLEKFNQGRWTDFGPEPALTDLFNDYIEDHQGTLWVGTDAAELWRVGTNGVVTAFSVPGVTTPQIGRGLLEDAEGNLWFGTGGSGLFRLKPRAFRNYNSRDGLASDLVRSVTQDGKGNMWFASINRVDWMPHGSSLIQARPTPVRLPWEVLGAADGGVWVGTYGEGLYRVPAGQDNQARYEQPPAALVPINAIFQRRSGQVELGTPNGLLELADQCLVSCPVGLELGRLDVRALAEDAAGRLYLGTDQRGLLRSSAGGWEHFTKTNGLGDERVRALYIDQQDVVWIGTQGGLSRFDGHSFFNFSAGLSRPGGALDLPRTITSLLEDDGGFLWLASNRGLYRVNKAQLNRAAQGGAGGVDVFRYDRADGMGSTQCTGDHQPAACKAQDGSLWFATMNGVTVVTPAALPFNSRPPPVIVEAVYADDSPRPLPLAGGGEVQIPAGSTRLEFRYAALTLTAPEKARFRYKLEPFDRDWIAAGNRRRADYTKAPPGTYQFHVIAANNDNVWNTQGAVLLVRVLPLFWQTNWFRAAVVLCLAAAGYWIYRWRVRDLHAQRMMQEAFSRRLIQSQELERKRMAAELHDSLGQSLLVLNNHAAMALKEAQHTDKSRQRLRKICDSASACIEEVRSIARSLRPYQLDRFGLTKTLEDVAELLANTSGLEVTTEIDNLDGLFAPETEISIYRIAQEWLNNVIKHARATSARLVARRESARVRLVLEDNGVGFDYAAVMAGGQRSFGLVNLRERVRLLGGALQLETAQGKGTRWLVEIPYATAHHGTDS